MPHETAAVSAKVLCTPYSHASCHFIQSQIRTVYSCLAVTCHLLFLAEWPESFMHYSGNTGSALLHLVTPNSHYIFLAPTKKGLCSRLWCNQLWQRRQDGRKKSILACSVNTGNSRTTSFRFLDAWSFLPNCFQFCTNSVSLVLHALMERKRSKTNEGPITRLYRMTRCDYSKRVAVGKSIAIRQFLSAGSGPTILTVIPAYSAFLTVLGSSKVT